MTGSPPAAPTGAPETNPLISAAWMVGALASFTTMAIAGRQITLELDTFQLMFYRSVLGFALVITLVAVTPGGFGKVRTSRIGMHGVRNIVHFAGQFSWFHALTLISMAEVFALEFTFPLWVAILAPLFLGERMTITRLIAVALGFAGVMIVLRPGVSVIGVGHMTMLFGALAFAFSSLATKTLTRTDTVWSILFWMTLIQMPLGLIPSIGNFAWPSIETIPWLIAVSIGGLTAHLCIAQAFRHADAIVVAPMDFMRLPLIAVVGWLVYAEPLDPWVLAGGCIILFGILVSLRTEQKVEKT